MDRVPDQRSALGSRRPPLPGDPDRAWTRASVHRLPPASRAAQAALSHTGNDGSSTRAKRPREARMREIGHFIGGKKVAGTSGRSGDLVNPNTGAVQAHVSLA